VHVRRALLLFAIVLGMAALAASLSRPPEQRTDTEARDSGPPTARPGPGSEDPPATPAAAVELVASQDESARLQAGRAATVVVDVDEPGTVEIPSLGLTGQADRFTPARFDVLPVEPDTHEVLFTPADGDIGEPAGRLVVQSAG
jgi:hypothetical protein